MYDIYSKLLKDRIIFIEGEINDKTSTLIISELLYLNSINHDDIYIYINSPGGSVSSGLAIYDCMNYIESDVCTIAVGLCASMAAFLLSGGKQGKRYSLKNSEIMIHEVLGGINGKASEIKLESDRIIKKKNLINKYLSKHTGKSFSQIEKDTKIDYFMDAKEAKDYGLIDKII